MFNSITAPGANGPAVDETARAAAAEARLPVALGPRSYGPPGLIGDPDSEALYSGYGQAVNNGDGTWNASFDFQAIHVAGARVRSILIPGSGPGGPYRFAVYSIAPLSSDPGIIQIEFIEKVFDPWAGAAATSFHLSAGNNAISCDLQLDGWYAVVFWSRDAPLLDFWPASRMLRTGENGGRVIPTFGYCQAVEPLNRDATLPAGFASMPAAGQFTFSEIDPNYGSYGIFLYEQGIA